MFEIERPVAASRTSSIPPCPYRGLTVFREQDAPFFFGREGFTQKLVQVCLTEPFTAIVGSVGSGKSSVVNAGLIPRLRQDRGDWLIASLRLGRHPYRALAGALLGLYSPGEHQSGLAAEVERLAQRLRNGEVILPQLGHTILRQQGQRMGITNKRMVVVVDQFEELYTHCEQAEERGQFIDDLAATAQTTGPVSIVLAMRADCMEQVLADRSMSDLLQASDLKLGPLKADELALAITKPADEQGVTFEPGLAERIMHDAGKLPTNLGLLQFTLMLLWPRQHNGTLTHAGYDDIGGMEKSLSKSVHGLLQHWDTDEKRRARHLVFHLAQAAMGKEDYNPAWLDSAGDRVVSQLTDARLLVRRQLSDRSVERLELVRDDVMAACEELRAWVQDDPASAPNPESSITSERRRRSSLVHHLTAQAELLSQQCQSLQHSALLAIEALRRAPSLKANQVLRRALALLPRPLARLAHDGQVNALALDPEGCYLATACQDGLARLWDANSGVEISRMQHADEVTGLAFSADGHRLATACADGTAHAWNVATAQETASITHTGMIRKITFNPNGSYVLTAGDDHMARAWSASTGREVACLCHDDSVEDASFSPDGKRIATASADHSARIWRLSDGQEITRTVHRDQVNTIAFSPDGRYVASGSCDQTVALWRSTNNQQVALIIHKGIVNAVAFSHNGRYMATASEDHTAQVWQVADHHEVLRVTHARGIVALAFSLDERLLATASRDGAVRVWDLASGSETACMCHDGAITSVAFNPDGRRLATASLDHSARIWQMMDKEIGLVRHNDVVAAVAFSPDGQCLATASWDRTGRVWDLANRNEKVQVQHQGNLNAIAFSPDGRLLATGSGSYFSLSRDDTARLWDITSGQEMMRIIHDGPVRTVSFSHNGQYLATGSEDHTVRVWEIESYTEIRRILCAEPVIAVGYSPHERFLAIGSGHSVHLWDGAARHEIKCITLDNDLSALAISPDGRTLAIADAGSIVRIWHDPFARDGEQIEIACEGAVQALAFAPDGNHLGVTHTEKNISVYDVRDGQEVTRITQDQPVTALAFSPDGRYLATASYDNAVRVWLLSCDDLIAAVRDRLTRSLSYEEWQQYLGEEPFAPAFSDSNQSVCVSYS